MDITELRIGNVIKISPRPNEEGVLFITDIQHSSVIGEMISPRLGYHFRIKHNEILPLELDSPWLEKIGLIEDVAGTWTDEQHKISVKLENGSASIKGGEHEPQLSFVHQLQNKYHELTQQELAVTPYTAG